MRILYLAHRIPFPPNKGDKIRSFHEIKYFSKNHEIHLVAFYDNPGDVAHADALREYCRDVILVPLRPWLQRLRAGSAMFQGKPWTLGYFRNPSMGEAVNKKLSTACFDLFFVFCSSMAPYVLSVDHTPKILDFVDSDASKWDQYAAFKSAPVSWLYGLEARRLAKFELAMAKLFDASVFVASREAVHFDGNGLGGRTYFIQNGIDLDFFQPSTPAKSVPTIIFTGVMDYFPNVDAIDFFAQKIFPLIRRRFSDARLLVVGSKPSAPVLRLARLPGVIVTGAVKDVRPYLASAFVSIAPMRISQGIQNKILEALAVGIPVVATPVAAAGISRLDDLPIAVAEQPDDFAERVAEYLSRPPLTAEQVSLCRQRLREDYSWEQNLSAFENLFEHVSATTPKGAQNSHSSSG